MKPVFVAIAVAIGSIPIATHAGMTTVDAYRYASAFVMTSEDPTTLRAQSFDADPFADVFTLESTNPGWGTAASTLSFDSRFSPSAYELNSSGSVSATSFNDERTRAASIFWDKITFSLDETTTLRFESQMQSTPGFSGSASLGIYHELDYDNDRDPIFSSYAEGGTHAADELITLDAGFYVLRYFGTTSVVEQYGSTDSGTFSSSAQFRIVPAPSATACLVLAGLFTARTKRATRTL